VTENAVMNKLNISAKEISDILTEEGATVRFQRLLGVKGGGGWEGTKPANHPRRGTRAWDETNPLPLREHHRMEDKDFSLDQKEEKKVERATREKKKQRKESQKGTNEESASRRQAINQKRIRDTLGGDREENRGKESTIIPSKKKRVRSRKELYRRPGPKSNPQTKNHGKRKLTEQVQTRS